MRAPVAAAVLLAVLAAGGIAWTAGDTPEQRDPQVTTLPLEANLHGTVVGPR